jgi:hypothetical protein
MSSAVELTQVERADIAERLNMAERYGWPRRVWVDDGHVFLENSERSLHRMTPEVALQLGSLLTAAGGHSMVNKLLDRDSVAEFSASADR